jgi:hypothetical protein
MYLWVFLWCSGKRCGTDPRANSSPMKEQLNESAKAVKEMMDVLDRLEEKNR